MSYSKVDFFLGALLKYPNILHKVGLLIKVSLVYLLYIRVDMFRRYKQKWQLLLSFMSFKISMIDENLASVVVAYIL